jgi:hypothetical protein
MTGLQIHLQLLGREKSHAALGEKAEGRYAWQVDAFPTKIQNSETAETFHHIGHR